MTPSRFEISIPQDRLADMRRRLAATRWADDFGNAGWRYGVERGWLEDMVAYWTSEFDWRAQEAAMNQMLWPWTAMQQAMAGNMPVPPADKKPG